MMTDIQKSLSAIRAVEYRKNNQEKIRIYNNTPERVKGLTISRWKNTYQIKSNDFNELYNLYVNTNYCNVCGVGLTLGRYGNSRKCLDHNHNTGLVNGIICKTCNTRDVLNRI